MIAKVLFLQLISNKIKTSCVLWFIGLFPRFFTVQVFEFWLVHCLKTLALVRPHSDCTLLFIYSYHQVFLRRSLKRSLQWRSEEDSKLFTVHRTENRDPEKSHQQLKGEREVHQRVLFWAGGEATAWVSYLKSLFNLCESLNLLYRAPNECPQLLFHVQVLIWSRRNGSNTIIKQSSALMF